MTVTVGAQGVIRMEGVCALDDAELLLRHLSNNPSAAVDWTGCDYVHTAVVQVLMAARASMLGAPLHPFLRDHLAALL
jgi:hypothetical protein